jgi:hypothetical protein
MNLDLKRAQVEYKRVNAAREEMEYKILESQEQINRLEANIEIQKAKEDELLAKIKDLQLKQ